MIKHQSILSLGFVGLCIQFQEVNLLYGNTVSELNCEASGFVYNELLYHFFFLFHLKLNSNAFTFIFFPKIKDTLQKITNNRKTNSAAKYHVAYSCYMKLLIEGPFQDKFNRFTFLIIELLPWYKAPVAKRNPISTRWICLMSISMNASISLVNVFTPIFFFFFFWFWVSFYTSENKTYNKAVKRLQINLCFMKVIYLEV